MGCEGRAEALLASLTCPIAPDRGGKASHTVKPPTRADITRTGPSAAWPVRAKISKANTPTQPSPNSRKLSRCKGDGGAGIAMVGTFSGAARRRPNQFYQTTDM